MELPYCIKVRKRMLKLDGKKEETSLGIYQFWPRKNDLQKWKEDSSVNYDETRGGLWN